MGNFGNLRTCVVIFVGCSQVTKKKKIPKSWESPPGYIDCIHSQRLCIHCQIIDCQRKAHSNVVLESFSPETHDLLPIGSVERQVVSSLCQVWSSDSLGSGNKWLRGPILGRDIYKFKKMKQVSSSWCPSPNPVIITWSVVEQWENCGKH